MKFAHLMKVQESRAFKNFSRKGAIEIRTFDFETYRTTDYKTVWSLRSSKLTPSPT